MTSTTPKKSSSTAQGFVAAPDVGNTPSPLFVDSSPSLLDYVNSAGHATTPVPQHTASDDESDGQIEMEDVIVAKLEEIPFNEAVRVKQEVTDENDLFTSPDVAGVNHGHDSVFADGQAEALSPAKEPAPVEEASTHMQQPEFNAPEPRSTPATNQPEEESNFAPPVDRSSVRYTIQNDHLQLTFSSRPARPFKQAMETFCERAGTVVETTRWLFEEARVYPTDTPQSMGMDKELDNTIWAHLETIGGGDPTTRTT